MKSLAAWLEVLHTSVLIRFDTLRLRLAHASLHLLGYHLEPLYDPHEPRTGDPYMSPSGVPESPDELDHPPMIYTAGTPARSTPRMAMRGVVVPYAAFAGLPEYPDESGARAVYHNLRAALVLLARHEANDAWLHDPYLWREVGLLVAAASLHVSASVDEFLESILEDTITPR